MNISTLPTFVPCPRNKRSRFLNLLQIGGVLLIIAAHTGVRGTGFATLALETFFVIAGLNMARYIDRHNTLGSFVWSRVRRLAPEISVVWCIALIVFFAGLRGVGMEAFLITTPLFLENFAEPYLRPVAGINFVFLAALWFVAALLQLQVIVFLMRKAFTRFRPLHLLLAVMSFELVFRAFVAEFHGGVTRDLAYESSDSIYRMAITHGSPFIFGFMMGRGLLPKIGRWFPLFAAITAVMGVLNYLFAPSHSFGIGTWGYPVGMPFNFQYLWGYPLVALLCTSFCAPGGLIASVIERVGIRQSLDHLANRLSRLTMESICFIVSFCLLSNMSYGPTALPKVPTCGVCSLS
jgi:acyltransferase-like protein